MMIRLFIIAVVLVSAGCATEPQWHWERQGSSQREFNREMAQCRAQALGSTGGYVNVGTVLIMNDCLEGKGWEKVANR